ncbi:hypothetical protein TVAGG3_1028490 [Trichomonas vaginalis G3]|uniref:hypothetical protein n=1 Tax=Trichomonas vaginalis (strain ATCC PRA-98 / G3) TaxID=412133 RepID=UPI0021E619E5|nr:hypothetical protein TVAGG3_1028490 [Trichomonas vaginalis G3]KAI5492679.1 hypothetical protein TVAGG3_1028490 [Trichomonas vaginalis G3]
MIKQQQLITYATYAYNSKTAEQTQRLEYGDLEIVLKNDHFEFVCKGGAVISNIKEILFMNSKIKGITDDITSIPPEEQRYYALNAFPKVLKIGRFNLNKEFIEGFLNDIMKKVDKEYVDSELMKKADKEYVNTELNKKADLVYVNTELNKKADVDHTHVQFDELNNRINQTNATVKSNYDNLNFRVNENSRVINQKAFKSYVDQELNKKANLVYVDEKDNEIKEKVEGYHEWTLETFKVKADTE